MTRELVRGCGDQVVVLHVREFSIARMGRMMTGGGGADGRRAVNAVVSGLRATGIRARGFVICCWLCRLAIDRRRLAA